MTMLREASEIEAVALALCQANLSGGCSEDCGGFDRPYCTAMKHHGEDAAIAIKALDAFRAAS